MTRYRFTIDTSLVGSIGWTSEAQEDQAHRLGRDEVHGADIVALAAWLASE